ncbi:polyserase-2 [Trichomycterus rosablanca]|uniref:polyserase-2 n=1 Tax=Trichomycterus rosablanca TaxID=2290929 RepID=UPI002F354964
MGLPLILLYLVIPTLLAQDCGIAPISTRIVGGMDASPGTWPWQVSIHYESQHICGGTLINREWVLSAAHCIVSTNTSEWTVYLGRNGQNTTNPHEVSRSVREIIVHPFYDNMMIDNDVALIKLSNPVDFTNYIRPVCLASPGSVFNTDTTCWATGWGNVAYNDSLPPPYILQEVQVPVVGNKQCMCQYENGYITPQKICAGEAGRGICMGDSGGPLQCQQNSVWVQAGISSFGVSCGGGDYPEVYTRVSEFQAWITQHIDESTIGFVTFKSTGFDADDYFIYCGIAPNNTQIAGGMNASAGTWPWQVSLYLGSNHTCGGTLINREWVLSAAHCMISPNTSEWTVYLGRNIQNTTNLPEVNRTVQQIIVHPFYNSTMMDNDVVLIKLSNPVNFTNDIRPICLASAGSVFNTDTTCWATGWGNATTNYSLPTPNLLQKVQVPVVGNKQCSCQRGNNCSTPPPPGTWPWLVGINHLGQHACGGSLINHDWVLSVASCFVSNNTSEWTVNLGQIGQNTTNLPEVTRSVQKIIVHPFYDNNMHDNDVALIKLSNPVDFNNTIRPVCLAAPGSVFSTDTTCLSIGLGNITMNG